MALNTIFPMTTLPAPGACTNDCPPWLGPQGDSITCVPGLPQDLGAPMCAKFVGDGVGQDVVIGYDPDVVWWKNDDLSSVPGDHMLQSTEFALDKILRPNNNTGFFTRSGYIQSFLVPGGGFALGDGESGTGSLPSGNVLGDNYTAWSFKKIIGHFDCGVYTGTGPSVERLVPHNLSVIPEMIIVKTTFSSRHWYLYHKDFGYQGLGFLSNSSAFSISVADTTVWGSANPTNTAFGVYSYNNGLEDLFYMMFASYPGLSKVGSFVSDGSVVIIPTDFVPSQMLIKNAFQVSDWNWVDLCNNPLNPITKQHQVSGVAVTLETVPDVGNFQSAQVEITTTDPEYNNPGDTYIYLITGYT